MWTRVAKTDLATAARRRMTANAMLGCEYHNNAHIDAMYSYLHSVDQPYDEALDWAVLFHDAVYDSAPDKEERSAELFLRLAQTYDGCTLDINGIDRVQLLIIETKRHAVTKDCYLCGSDAIIRADLHALTDKLQTTQNFVKIMNESINLYACTVEQYADNTIAFMSSLKPVIAENDLQSADNFYIKVIQGIHLTTNLAKALKGAEQ